MDSAGDASFSEIVTIDERDIETYSVSSVTKNRITNQFDDADPKLYEGLKDQFSSFRYLFRSNWTGTYPEPAVIDCRSERMIRDLQYRQDIEEDPEARMPVESFLPDYKNYDVIIGYRSDDAYFLFARAFVSNEISLSQLGLAMKLGKLGFQYCIKSEKAFSKLKFLDYVVADNTVYYNKKKIEMKLLEMNI